MSPRIDIANIGGCLNEECNGQFFLDDGVTLYNHETSGIVATLTNPGTTGCVVVIYRSFFQKAVLDDMNCNNQYHPLCKCSP